MKAALLRMRASQVKVLKTKVVREKGGAVLGVHEVKLQGKGILVTWSRSVSPD